MQLPPSLSIRFDYKDALLLPLGFLGLVVCLTWLKKMGIEAGRGSMEGLAVASLFGPVWLRRWLFGEPELPAPKTGIFFRMASVLGLLCTFAGTAALALASYHLSWRGDAAPDFRKESIALFESTRLIDFAPAGETPEETTKRHAREHDEGMKEALREAERRASEWQGQQDELNGRYLKILCFGIGLCALGALAIYWRYPREPAS